MPRFSSWVWLALLSACAPLSDRDRALRELRQAASRADQGEVEEAAQQVRRALLFEPRLADAWLLDVALAEARGDASAARQSLNRGLALLPDDPGLLAAHLATLRERRSPAVEAAEIREPLRRAGPYPALLQEAGWVALAHQQAELAERAFRLLLAGIQQDPASSLGLALAEDQLGQGERAWRRLARLLPDGRAAVEQIVALLAPDERLRAQLMTLSLGAPVEADPASSDPP